MTAGEDDGIGVELEADGAGEILDNLHDIVGRPRRLKQDTGRTVGYTDVQTLMPAETGHR